jgi:hypothetical protein
MQSNFRSKTLIKEVNRWGHYVILVALLAGISAVAFQSASANKISFASTFLCGTWSRFVFDQPGHDYTSTLKIFENGSYDLDGYKGTWVSDAETLTLHGKSADTTYHFYLEQDERVINDRIKDGISYRKVD